MALLDFLWKNERTAREARRRGQRIGARAQQRRAVIAKRKVAAERRRQQAERKQEAQRERAERKRWAKQTLKRRQAERAAQQKHESIRPAVRF